MIKNMIINNINNNNIPEIEEDFDNIFVLFRNEYDNESNLKYSSLEAAQDYIITNEKLTYKNIIISPSSKNNNSVVNDSLLYIMWFTADNDPYFNKDAIREKHIWKD